MKIDFNAEDHSYAIDGIPVPGVTRCLEPMYDFRFVDPEALERAADMGRKVHKTVELFELGTLVRASLHPILEAHLQQWEKFKREMKFRPRRFETKVASKRYSYAGTYDSDGFFEEVQGIVECEALLDIKTGDPYPAHKLQTAGYKKAGVDMGLLTPKCKRACLYLSEADYKIAWHVRDMDEPVFLGMVALHHWNRHQ